VAIALRMAQVAGGGSASGKTSGRISDIQSRMSGGAKLAAKNAE